MANLQETPTWEAGIYQLETSDPVMGGENGIDNRAPRQLANRTLWLKNELARQIEAVNSGKLGKTENAVSATKLATARNISTTGDATWSVLFDGSTNASGALTLANSGVTAGSYNAVTVDSKGRVTRGLTQVHGLITATTATGTANQATTNTNTYLNIVASGVGSTASVGSSTQVTGTNGISISSDTTGQLIISRDSNSPTATKLQTPCTINGVAFDGTANITIADATKAPAVHRHNWSEIDGKPSTFTPSSHTHTIANITDYDVRQISTEDLDSITKWGIYGQGANNQSLTKRNYPVPNEAGTLEVMPGTYSLRQRFTTFASHRTFERSRNSAQTGWNAWTELSNTWGAIRNKPDNLAYTSSNIASATKLQTARTISLTGAVTGSVNFDGSGNVSLATTLTAANVREYSSTMTSIYGTSLIIPISGQVVTSPDGRITQYIHLQHFRDTWFPMNQNSVGNYSGEGTRSRLLQIPLWTAMPIKILSVSAQAMRSTHSTQSFGFSGEAAEHQVAWAKRQQADSKTHAFVEMARIYGGASEEIDMFIIVEGY